MKTFVQERYFTFKPIILIRDFLRPIYRLLPARLRATVRSIAKLEAPEKSFFLKTIIEQREELTVFDVGAFTGEFSFDLHQYVPQARFYCFEPYSLAFEQLKILAKEWANFTLCNCALSDETNTRHLYEYGYPKTNSFLQLRDITETKDAIKQGTTVAKTTTLDLFCADRQIDQIDLLHVDVNGTEIDVLNGALGMIRGNKIFCVSIIHRFDSPYSNSCVFDEINQVLYGNGYQLIEVMIVSRGKSRMKKAQIIYVHN